MGLLNGKVAIVTGGARDIGRATSVSLAKEGAAVCINYHKGEDQANETLEMIASEGGKAIIVQGDMTRRADVERLVLECTKAFGPQIHLLANVCGGLLGRKTMDELDEDFWDAVISVNLKSAYLVTKTVLPHMPSGSAIVNFASQAARDGGGPGAIAYATAKGGVLTFTRGLAKELGPKGIRVNAVSPGMIDTTFHNTFTKPEVREKVAAATPLRREGMACEVADLVTYLCSTRASFITGSCIEINGGTYFI
jgi:3-oxoacyl-[acyl-carrier protein] reductase